MSKPLALLSLLVLAAPPVAAQQQSESYKFLQAVRDEKGNEVIAALDKPGSQIVNTRDVSTGEGALHIVVKRGDARYTRYLLQKGANANMRDAKGNTPMLLAVTQNQPEIVTILIDAKANVNLGNSSGETPLIRSVQRRDLSMARELLAAGADPDQSDVIAGMSARDYAAQDTRNPAIAKLIADTPKRAKRGISGPKF